MSSEDEEAVEIELNELITVEHQKVIDQLPTIPLDDLPITVPGNSQCYTIIINSILHSTNLIQFILYYYILKHIYLYDLEIKEREKSPPKKVALEAQ